MLSKLKCFGYLRLLAFLLPFLIWIEAFKEFLTKKALIDLDTYTIYTITKYLFINLKYGFPDWNPYSLWGMGHLRQMGEFNPFLYIIPVLDSLGLDFYQSFLSFMFLYFFLGALGLYCLTHLLLKDKVAAYMAFLLFLLSSISMLMFIQVTYILLFVPVIWFFFFLFDFFKDYKRSSFLFLIFTLMMIVTTYIPFYFMTTFLTFLVLYIVFYFKEFKNCIVGLFHFIKENGVLVFLCFLGLMLAVYPSFQTWLSLKSYLKPLARPTTLTYEIVRNGGIPVTEIFRDFSLFSLLLHSFQIKMLQFSRELYSLMDIPFDNHRLFYIPLFAHLSLTTTLMTRAGKRLFFLSVLCVSLFLLAAVNLSPVYEFLFENIFYFRMYRNVFLLLAVLIICYILLVCEQFHLLTQQAPKTVKGKALSVLWVLLIHLAWFFFLSGQQNVLASTYITLGASSLFFVLISCNVLRLTQNIFPFLLLLLIVIQPLQVFKHFVRNAEVKRSEIISESIENHESEMTFSFSRPLLDKEKFKGMSDKDIYRDFFADLVDMKDSSGFVSDRYGYPTVWSAQLHEKIPYALLGPYIKNKLLVYDSIKFVADEDMPFGALAKNLNQLTNEVYISQPVDEESQVKYMRMFDDKNKEKYPQADIIRDDGKKVTIRSFSANRIVFETHFKTDKFLVYNDSYHPQWRAAINNREVPLHRSNFAFKGLAVPAGDQTVTLTYGSAVDTSILLLLFVLSLLSLGAGIGFHIKERRASL